METPETTTQTPEGAVFTEAEVQARIAEAVARAGQPSPEGALTMTEVQNMVAEATVKATRDATAAERARILAIYAACTYNKAEAMFARFVEDGSNEQQANGRILDAIAMRNESNDISSRHSGGSTPRRGLDTQAIYNSRG